MLHRVKFCRISMPWYRVTQSTKLLEWLMLLFAVYCQGVWHRFCTEICVLFTDMNISESYHFMFFIQEKSFAMCRISRGIFNMAVTVTVKLKTHHQAIQRSSVILCPKSDKCWFYFWNIKWKISQKSAEKFGYQSHKNFIFMKIFLGKCIRQKAHILALSPKMHFSSFSWLQVWTLT